MKKITVLLIVSAIILVGCGSNTSHTTQTTPVNNWYDGGTLHKATISDWNNATDKNKLATCADFMATVDSSVSMTELKKRATNLKNCIDEATSETSNVSSRKVSEMASLCIVTMEY